MPARRPRKHSSLYYRNLMIAVGSFVFTFGAALMRGVDLVSMLWFLPLLYLNYLVWVSFAGVHPPRRRLPRWTPREFDMEYEEVEFRSRDGLRLAGWFIPSHNGAVVILVHGAGGAKVAMLKHAQLLVTEGFGALLFDLRAHGDSEGDTINGFDEANDLLGAVDYLRLRNDLDRNRIGVLGISLGALVTMRAAAQNENIRAVVLDSMGPVCLDDHDYTPNNRKYFINRPINWFMYALGDFIAGKRITEGARRLLPRIAPRPVMLIAAGPRWEPHFNRIFLEAAGEPKSLWVVERAHHGAAYIFEPEAYREKVRAFFRRYLLAR